VRNKKMYLVLPQEDHGLTDLWSLVL
jgi:hypothetical protein